MQQIYPQLFAQQQQQGGAQGVNTGTGGEDEVSNNSGQQDNSRK